jgi:predicted Zn-dependent protease
MLVGYAPAERLAARAGDIRRTLSSFGPVTDRAALTVSPARVRVVTLPDDMTLPEFAQRWPSSVPLETLALVNGVEKGARLRAGDRVKQIVGGAPLARR